MKTLISLNPIDQNDQSIDRENDLFKLKLIFKTISITEYEKKAFIPTKLIIESSDYINEFKKILILSSIQLYYKPKMGIDDFPTRKKANSLDTSPKSLSPIKNINLELKKQLLIQSAINNSDSHDSNSFREDITQFSPTIEIPSYEEIKGNILNIAVTQNGSRKLQKFFIKCSQIELDNVLYEIKQNFYTIMTNTYANYMLQTLIQRCTPEQRFFILDNIGSCFVNLVCDKKGTHSIQTLVSLVNSEKEENFIMNTIKDDILMIIFDNQGTHFIQKIINRFKKFHIEKILLIVIQNFIDVVENAGGICVIKLLITRFKDEKEIRFIIIDNIEKNLEILIEDPFGNYAIQHIIDIYFQYGEIFNIIYKILNNVIYYSNQKFSSNVIEKCILSTNNEIKRAFMKQFSKDQIMKELMLNKYGNFVLKKCFSIADPLEYEELYQAAIQNIPLIQNTKFYAIWKEFR